MVDALKRSGDGDPSESRGSHRSDERWARYAVRAATKLVLFACFAAAVWRADEHAAATAAIAFHVAATGLALRYAASVAAKPLLFFAAIMLWCVGRADGATTLEAPVGSTRRCSAAQREPRQVSF
tara:strand:- start:307 stop:681 length:375 start_codon:yes stop_codon:yes gene_type:complete